MSTRRTVDHTRIREWVEKHAGMPALIAGTTTDESSGVLTIVFGRSNPEIVPIEWPEFFGMFESRHLRFRYEEPLESGKRPEWSFGFEDRSDSLDTDTDETQLPEDQDAVEENMFPSARRNIEL